MDSSEIAIIEAATAVIEAHAEATIKAAVKARLKELGRNSQAVRDFVAARGITGGMTVGNNVISQILREDPTVLDVHIGEDFCEVLIQHDPIRLFKLTPPAAVGCFLFGYFGGEYPELLTAADPVALPAKEN